MLSWIQRTLSKDPLFLRQVRAALFKRATMEANRGWRCETCRIMNKKLADYCQKCGGFWQHCHDSGDQSWAWTAQSETRQSRPRSSSARRRTKTGKGGGKNQEKGKGAGNKGQDGKPAPSPFAAAAYSQPPTPGVPWPLMDFDQYQQTSSASTTSNQQVANQSTQELVNALKKAFPESATMPQPLRDALGRAELQGTRQITKDLHAATSALGRAKRAHIEAHEARKQLKQGWMKHLQESIQAWESQLDTYRANLAKLQDAEAKALQEVSVAKRTIQQLNSQSEGAVMDETAPVEETTELLQDKEEEKLRQQLQDTMRSCLSTVGISKADILEISDDDGKEGNDGKKRPRPAEEVMAGTS